MQSSARLDPFVLLVPSISDTVLFLLFPFPPFSAFVRGLFTLIDKITKGRTISRT